MQYESLSLRVVCDLIVDEVTESAHETLLRGNSGATRLCKSYFKMGI